MDEIYIGTDWEETRRSVRQTPSLKPRALCPFVSLATGQKDFGGSRLHLNKLGFDFS